MATTVEGDTPDPTEPTEAPDVDPWATAPSSLIAVLEQMGEDLLEQRTTIHRQQQQIEDLTRQTSEAHLNAGAHALLMEIRATMSWEDDDPEGVLGAVRTKVEHFVRSRQGDR